MIGSKRPESKYEGEVVMAKRSITRFQLSLSIAVSLSGVAAKETFMNECPDVDILDYKLRQLPAQKQAE